MVIVDKKEKPIVLFPINANPPTIGHLMAITTLLKMAQKVIIVVYDGAQAMPTDISIDILVSLLSNYKDSNRLEIMKSAVNFSTISEIPDNLKILEKAYTIATTSRHIYANLNSKGYPYLMFVRKPLGWRDEFYRIAFMRSITLHNMEVINSESERRNMYGKQKK